MTDEILAKLSEIESEKNIEILFAVESGSRAWGFASPDSDFDVRFVYRHNPDWYLSVFDDRRDVIEMPITDLLDFSGWDLKKAVKLLHGGNYALCEWIHSPDIYLDRGCLSQFRTLAADCYRPDRAHYHYLAMARGTRDKHLSEGRRGIKKIFYALRAVFAALWNRKFNSMPPVRFTEMLITDLAGSELIREIHTLIDEKSRKNEKDQAVNCELIIPFIDEQITVLERFKPEKHDVSRQQTDEAFRRLLQQPLNP